MELRIKQLGQILQKYVYFFSWCWAFSTPTGAIEFLMSLHPSLNTSLWKCSSLDNLILAMTANTAIMLMRQLEMKGDEKKNYN